MIRYERSTIKRISTNIDVNDIILKKNENEIKN